MYRVFDDSGVKLGKVLSYNEFLEVSELAHPKLDDEKMEKVIELAEEALEEEIPFIPLYYYREFKITGNRNHLGAPFNKRRNMLLHLCLAEYYEKKGRFASKLCDLVWAILEETSWIIAAHAVHNPENPAAAVPPVYNETSLHGLDLTSGTTGALLALTLTLNGDVYDNLSPFLRERIEYELEKRIIKPFTSRVFNWSGSFGNKCNNWCPWITENVLFTTALVEKRDAVRRAVVARSLTYLDNYTAWLPEDGGCDEGPGYWGAAGGGYFSCLQLIEDITGGEINVYSHPHVRNIGEYIAKMNINGGRFVNFADCSPNTCPSGALVMRFGEKVGSEMLYAFGRMIASFCSNLPAPRRPSSAIRDMIMPIPKNVEPTRAKLNTWMPALKVLISRESADTSKGMLLAMKGGHNQESHNHNDVGSFIVCKDGNMVIIDPGSCTYTRDTFGKNRYTIWCMQSHYHNLPAFDGEGERQGKEFCSSREVYDEETHTLSLGLETAYTKAAGVLSYTRTANLNGGRIVISEDIALDAEREIDFRLMTAWAPEELAPGTLRLREGVILSFDESLSYTLEEFKPDNQNTESAWGTPCLYRMHFTTRAKEYKGEFVFTSPDLTT